MNTYNSQQLYTTLKDLQVVDLDLLKNIYQESEESNTSFHALLLKKNIISDDNLGKVVADLIELPYVKISDFSIPDSILQILPEEFAQAQNCIVFKKEADSFFVATSDPDNQNAIALIRKKIGENIELYYTTPKELSQAFLLYKQDITGVFEDIIAQNAEQAKKNKDTDPPIIKIVDTILVFAFQKKVSDIHIEPQEEKSLIRFRIDGILHDMVTLPIDLHPRIVTRIKVLAQLRTDEHQAPQDGKIHFDVSQALKNPEKVHQELSTDQFVDLRVSIVPSTDGEKIVMRLLAEENRKLSLEDLGFATQELEIVQKAYQKPHGMILATGPTGSGKTTTMYSILKMLNTRDVNISTIEDPVEYDIEGITQIQVNTKTNLTFSQGLKSIVRQDPDIILVGEIRDEETADIAVNSAMTGHLVLSTLHTNDSATTFPRLIEMEVEPFLIASTVNVVIAQRLVRKIHLKCRASQIIEREKLEKYFDTDTIQKILGDEQSIRIYTGTGCSVCKNTGYEGRIGVYEVLEVDDDVREAIVDQKDAATIRQIAKQNGMRTMLDDGLEKVKNGLTTIDEIIRVLKEE